MSRGASETVGRVNRRLLLADFRWDFLKNSKEVLGGPRGCLRASRVVCAAPMVSLRGLQIQRAGLCKMMSLRGLQMVLLLEFWPVF